jgi:UDPglucose--hexose-1-phosphate uridylyltransferase
MPELRKDPVIGRWVIIATERARRPGVFFDSQKNIFDSNDCSFCHNQDPQILSYPQGDSAHQVKVVQSGTPLLLNDGKFHRKGHGLYDVVNDYGTHEVVIETPEHIANMADLSQDQIRLVFETYAIRYNELAKDPSFQYVIAYKNYGWAAGSRRIGHSRSQIIATSVNPFSAKQKLDGAKKYFNYRERCLYCDMIQQELEAKVRIIAETEHFVAMTPFAPRFVFEIWILPKKHDCDFAKGVVGQEHDLAKMMKLVLTKLKVGLDDPAYNYVIQSAPFRHGDTGTKWKTLGDDYHWHIEVSPRLTRVAGFEKGSGFYISSIPPENVAEFLREVQI